ncbi:hypothetical protein [Streptomyces sp. TR06-5]|uniref:hypothetical protein n=1 Tax=unclassified Streptomyces TaxID=2593676 RepID=UPI0039A12C03
MSGQRLTGLFDTWLFTPSKPAVGPNGERGAAAEASSPRAERGAEETLPVEPPSWRKIQRSHEGGHGRSAARSSDG